MHPLISGALRIANTKNTGKQGAFLHLSKSCFFKKQVILSQKEYENREPGLQL